MSNTISNNIRVNFYMIGRTELRQILISIPLPLLLLLPLPIITTATTTTSSTITTTTNANTYYNSIDKIKIKVEQHMIKHIDRVRNKI